MLKDFACRYAIVGHSERRQYHGETDEVVASKAQRALAAGITPIVCVGESLEIREAGNTIDFILEQVTESLEGVSAQAVAGLVIAYEPVWAIGTGLTASPDEAQDVHCFIRDRISSVDVTMAGLVRILYGGSVKAANAAELFAMPDVDGGLIGGASLTTEFTAIVEAAAA
jgi:triosephosphate isomerase